VTTVLECLCERYTDGHCVKDTQKSREGRGVGSEGVREGGRKLVREGGGDKYTGKFSK
jgi:hypothetical protein